ncbi:hypothetical protein COCMIDRAFT_111027 [Bipolaris oryzae ATCC 44560]|uniref:Uncharacterized protein n=1 Tax=Bipolaris oryzae ATCC 44560 TaxID=930090 RepID=W6YQ30_COCMI|nr:uncharacterized protein COCMIDRAFT_111027 [Bipolaris oryzae ATCC 44560]EUC39623.1 hypothetical protein COCMIDRAFT_111027 [Bipolaris oryzae ATCC 44560]
MRRAKPHQDRPEEPLGMCCGGRGRLAWPLPKRRHASGPGMAMLLFVSVAILHVQSCMPWPSSAFFVATLLWTRSGTKQWTVSTAYVLGTYYIPKCTCDGEYGIVWLPLGRSFF